MLRVQAHLAARVAEHDLGAVGDAERRRILGMDHHGRAGRSRAQRGRRLVEGRIEEAARRRGRRAGTDAPASASSITVPVVGQRRHRVRPARRCQGERNGTFGQSGLKRNLPSGQAKPFDVVRGVEVRLAVDPAFCASSSASVPQPEFCKRPVDQLARRSCRSPDARRRGAWPARRCTSWLERHSPGGSISFGPSMMYWWPPP